ncbi:MAG: hypothetical protein SFV24_18260 [Gemmatimonadales bacterium]|nr:hypothetical protein [Gemmatimonadales bacterium]
MTISALERTPPSAIGTSVLARRLALDATVPAVLFASAAIVIGLHWDIAWHRAIGRDTFWSPPHVLEQVAAAVAGLFCGWRVLYTSFFAPQADRDQAVRWWGVFFGPLGGWVCIWGTIAMITSAPFDDWWHNAYGLDVEILTPPHVFLLLGMVTVQLGAMLMMLASQNRQATRNHSLVFSASMGLIVLMIATMVYAETGIANLQHRPAFYQIAAALFPIFLVAVARAGRSRWPATTAALVYSAIMIVMNWVLALVPATPMLAPIYNPVTNLVPPGFPILVVVPAVAIDWLVRRFEGRSDWLLAPAIGVAFVALLAAVQWPFATFLLSLDQPNYFFGQGYWDYTAKLGDWTRTFFDVPGYTWVRGKGWTGSVDVGAMAMGLTVAAGFAAVASRLGLAWGTWMTRVRR